MEYKFYGAKDANCKNICGKYSFIKNPRDLYDALTTIWSKETCAPRLRDKWSENNKTVGQCSITAFLAQDIFGGQVRGIKRPDGSVHCFNVVGNSVFDLASEQFGKEKLDYEKDTTLELRLQHFSDMEKYDRYTKLVGGLYWIEDKKTR